MKSGSSRCTAGPRDLHRAPERWQEVGQVTQVLVVDDDDSIRRALGRYFERDGRYRLFLAADGFEALGILEREQIDFALIDLHMPRMSGIELVDRCDRTFPNLLYVVMSGFDDVIAQANQKLRLHPVLLRKPFELRQLDGIVAGAVKGEMWAQVRAMGPHNLRRGGWYQIHHDATDESDVMVHVGNALRRIRRGGVTLAGQRPPAWSIVQQDFSIPLPPIARKMGDRYGVCPNCLFRSAIGPGDSETLCEQCGRIFAVNWNKM